MSDEARLESLYAIRDFVAHEIEVELGHAVPMGADNPIVVAVSGLYDVDPCLVVTGGRGERVTNVRHCVAWILARGGMSTRQIARLLGYADKNTAVYACRKIDHDAGTQALLRGLEVQGLPVLAGLADHR